MKDSINTLKEVMLFMLENLCSLKQNSFGEDYQISAEYYDIAENMKKLESIKED